MALTEALVAGPRPRDRGRDGRSVLALAASAALHALAVAGALWLVPFPPLPEAEDSEEIIVDLVVDDPGPRSLPADAARVIAATPLGAVPSAALVELKAAAPPPLAPAAPAENAAAVPLAAFQPPHAQPAPLTSAEALDRLRPVAVDADASGRPLDDLAGAARPPAVPLAAARGWAAETAPAPLAASDLAPAIASAPIAPAPPDVMAEARPGHSLPDVAATPLTAAPPPAGSPPITALAVASEAADQRGPVAAPNDSPARHVDGGPSAATPAAAPLDARRSAAPGPVRAWIDEARQAPVREIERVSPARDQPLPAVASLALARAGGRAGGMVPFAVAEIGKPIPPERAAAPVTAETVGAEPVKLGACPATNEPGRATPFSAHRSESGGPDAGREGVNSGSPLARERAGQSIDALVSGRCLGLSDAPAPSLAAQAAVSAPEPLLRENPAPAAPAPPTRLAAVAAGPGTAGHDWQPEEAVEAVVNGLDCARVRVRFDRASGGVVLSGHLRSETERRLFLDRLQEIPGLRRPDASALHVVGDPYCRVLTFLGREEFRRSDDQRHDVAAIGNPAQAGVMRLSAGAPLKLDLAAPKFDSFIYVDYFSADGRVYHLLPGDSPVDNRFAADASFAIGGPNGRGRRATIGPPYGLDLVVAIASSRPLFGKPRPVEEGAGDYLAALDAAIAALRAGGSAPRLEYAYHLIYTAPRP